MPLTATGQTAQFSTPLKLASGKTLPEFEIAYETYGEMAQDGNNAILICHGLTTDQHAADGKIDVGNGPQEKSGWWASVIGPGLAIDTERFFVVCSNVLGGFGGSTGAASQNPQTGNPYAMDFPVVTIADMVDAQYHLAGHLGVDRFHGVAGGCMGGFQVLEWLCRYPEKVARAAIISATPRVSIHTQAMWAVLREAIKSDRAWKNGDYYGGPSPDAGMALMAKIGSLFWMSRDVMESRFGAAPINDGKPGYTFEADFEIETFLKKVGKGAAEKIDPNCLLYLTRAMDYFDISRDYGGLDAALEKVTASTLLVSYDSDWRYPSSQIDPIRLALEKAEGSVDHKILESGFGHGAFVYDSQALGPLLKTFLEED